MARLEKLDDALAAEVMVEDIRGLDAIRAFFNEHFPSDDDEQGAEAEQQAVEGPDQAEDDASQEESGSEPTVPATPTVDLEAAQQDERFAYLWEGNHGKYVLDDERRRRVELIRDVWEFVPPCGLIPAYIKCMLRTTDAAPIYHLAAALAVAAHLLNRRVSIEEGFGRVLPNLWIAAVGASTLARKSTSVNPAARLLEEDLDYCDTLLSDMFSLEGLYTALGYVEKDEEAVRLRREECEAAFNSGNPFLKGVGLFHTNEVSILLENLDKNYNAGGKNLLTDWYDGKPQFKKPTKGQGIYYIWRPCVSILGATTISWLNKSCNASDRDGGWLPRWLFFYGGKEKDYYLVNPDTPTASAKQAVQEQMAILKNIPVTALTISGAAMDLYAGWQRQLIGRCEESLQSWMGRMIATTKKVAMIYELTVNPTATEISPCAFERAMKLIDRLFTDLHLMMDTEIAFGYDDEKLKKVLNHIRAAAKKGIGKS